MIKNHLDFNLHFKNLNGNNKMKINSIFKEN